MNYIIGMSPNNDGHILNSIWSNKNLEKIVFYYKTNTDKDFIDAHLPRIFQCEHIDGLWDSIGCRKPAYNIKMQVNDRKQLRSISVFLMHWHRIVLLQMKLLKK